MKTILYTSLFIAATLSALGAPRSWTFEDGTTLRLNLPDGFSCEQISPSSDTKNQAFTLRYLDSQMGSTISYQFMVTKADPSTDWSTVQKIDAFLMRAGQKGLQGSVEKELKPVHLKMKQGVGSYLVFTDADLVNKPISGPRIFKHMTMVVCGVGGYSIFIRGYTNSKSDLYFTQMNQLIEGAEIVSK